MTHIRKNKSLHIYLKYGKALAFFKDEIEENMNIDKKAISIFHLKWISALVTLRNFIISRDIIG